MENEKEKRALYLAKEAHEGQARKGSGEAYIVHPVRVYEIVKEYSDDTDIRCAALLHDVVEDTAVTYDDIRKELGERVARIVKEVSTSKRDKKNFSCKRRKEDTILSIYGMSMEAQIVEAADKVANAKDFSKLRDEYGVIHFDGFKEKNPLEQEWYYRSLYEAFCDSSKSSVVSHLAEKLREYTDIGFGRSYGSYLHNKSHEQNTSHLFSLRMMFAKNKDQAPLLIEVVAPPTMDQEELCFQIASKLQQLKIHTVTLSSYLKDTRNLTAEELVTSIGQVQKKSTSTDIILLAGGLTRKKIEILQEFEEEREKNPSAIYDTLEELDIIKDGQENLLDGVVAVIPDDPVNQMQVEDYACDYEQLLGALSSLPDSIPQIVSSHEDITQEVLPFILNTSDVIMKRKNEGRDGAFYKNTIKFMKKQI